MDPSLKRQPIRTINNEPPTINMILIQRQAASHWYLRDGRAFHEIAKRDGSGNRPVTLADARKVMALPSVTNVLGVLAKPGLDAWKIEQGIMAALTLPRLGEEPLDVFAHRVVADMGEQVEKAADFGSAIHAACEVYALEKQLPEDPRSPSLLRLAGTRFFISLTPRATTDFSVPTLSLGQNIQSNCIKVNSVPPF